MDLIYPATNSGDISGYDLNGKKNNEYNISSLINQLTSNNFVSNGLTVSDNGGLEISITTGECNISGRRVEINTARTETLTDDTTNYIYLQLQFDIAGNVTSVDVVTNETGTQPDDSVYLANVTTSSGNIDTIVDERTDLYVANANSAEIADDALALNGENWEVVAEGNLTGNGRIDLLPAQNHYKYNYSVYSPDVNVIIGPRSSGDQNYILKNASGNDELVIDVGTENTAHYKVWVLR